MHGHPEPLPHLSFAGRTDAHELAEARRRIMGHEMPGVLASMLEAHGEIDREELSGDERIFAQASIDLGIRLIGFLSWKVFLISRRLTEIEGLEPGTPDSHWSTDPHP